ncbi:MAG TPA: thiamine pyrophosphate-dependent enzyme, partial [Chthoniobacterales bacterium]|nr:thiamine pyrophosphate-dependent enzyme [Chthoniobacterales bacterium]
GGAVARARAGGPPQLVVASTLRLAGHGEHDDASYVAPEMKKEDFARDPLERAEEFIKSEELADAETLAEWRAEAVKEVNEAISTAQEEAAPDGAEEDWCALSMRGLVDRIS